MTTVLSAPSGAAGIAADPRFSTQLLPAPLAASHGMWPDGTQVTDAGRSTLYRHIARHDIADLVLMYANPKETTNPITVTAGIEFPLGTKIELHFAGEDANRGKVIPAGTVERNQPSGISLKTGDVFYTNTLVVPSAGGSYPTMGPMGFIQNNAAETSNQRCVTNTTTDYSATGAAANPGTAGSLYGYGPIGVCATPATPALRAHCPTAAGEGDSILCGTGDDQAIAGLANFESGWVTRACAAASLAFLNMAVSGSAGQATAGATDSMNRLRKSLAGCCTYTFWQWITNDLLSNVTYATISVNYAKGWQQLAQRGSLVLASTSTPRTTSTDSWATTVNQTPVSTDFGPETSPSVRQQYHNWLRDGAPMTIATFTPVAVGNNGAGVGRCAVYSKTGALVTAASGTTGHPAWAAIDPGGAVEVFDATTNNWVWSPAMITGGDGVHPNSAGHIAMAAAVPTSLMT